MAKRKSKNSRSSVAKRKNSDKAIDSIPLTTKEIVIAGFLIVGILQVICIIQGALLLTHISLLSNNVWDLRQDILTQESVYNLYRDTNPGSRSSPPIQPKVQQYIETSAPIHSL